MLLVGQFMAILDATIVTVSAPAIGTELRASGAALQLVVAGYTIVYAVLLITGARLGRRFGHRRLFLVGLALFTVASLACGLAATTTQLIAFRLGQGAGAALLVPQVLSLIQLTLDGPARARAFSVYATVLSGAAVAGQILGGVLTSADIAGTGWRPIFLVNVPIGLLLLAAGARLLPADRPDATTGLDLPGLLTLSPAVLMVVTPLVLGHELGWPGWGWAALAGSAVFVAAFSWTQRRAAALLVPGPVLRAPGLALAAASIFAMMAGYAGFLFTMALYLQDGLGLSTLESSLAFVLSSVGFGTASLNWRRVPARFHHRMIPIGLALSALGYLVVAAITANLGSPGVLYQAAVVVSGVGMGLAFSPALNAALTHVAPADAASASGVTSTVTQLGQVAGVAGLGAVFLSLNQPSGSVATAAAVTDIGVAALVFLAAVFAVFLPRRQPRAI
ncbi:MFS transporter [Amycolatopsis sp. YIM 10]|uniref:MFS transporter n=1 Tax=Amycolatopsis sp. YIM 10 TaxID=2653857 RepID=UPI0012A88679|nr:MFS transporter [Amycolatopsis sp. YIM 10]QFU89821.1 putative MFS-type transporter EfpA [Amycolatopsis sp. YIM 10]